jgi:PH/SEC7 domain-containing protein
MSSKQFVRNTMAAIHAQFPAGAKLPSRTSGRSLTLDSYPASEAAASGSSRGSFEKLRDNLSRTKRSDSVSSFGSDGHDPGSHPVMARQKSMPVPSTSQKTWDADMELLLKDIYQEIKARPIYQPLSSNETEGRSSISLSPTSSPYATWRGDVSRTASRRSQVSVNGSDRNISAKRASIRGFGFLGSDPMRSASPSPSTNTSLSDSLAATGYGSSLTAASSPFASTPIIGFAGSLSQTIIREQQEDDAQSDDGMLATEEELALLGAPWAKEGILQRKHYWEAPSKRSKDKTWLQVFVVIAKGEVRMFKFGDSSAKGSSSGMGGGNWMVRCA